ncbi:hypothetical protein QBC35DRAFT_487922 [Podospora australis]|uniref:Ubiquitin 3 binding protein But2 C-terminal domain-containing protein n=1 Tax=Podospora australis TaxID=1536484 RepID=A0AAN7AMX4_9PEZI|nr:hypothetical protein QBC35DRAFT_487922 [Podospora australis]
MQLTLLATLLLPITVALAMPTSLIAIRETRPRAKIVDMRNWKPSGSGCKSGTFDAKFSNNYETVTFTFDKYNIEDDSGNKDCELEVRVLVPRRSSKSKPTRYTLEAFVTHSGEIKLESREESARISREYTVKGLKQSPADVKVDGAQSGKRTYRIEDKVTLSWPADVENDETVVYKVKSGLRLDSPRSKDDGYVEEEKVVFDIGRQ